MCTGVICKCGHFGGSMEATHGGKRDLTLQCHCDLNSFNVVVAVVAAPITAVIHSLL